jgi:hypothetical protein
VRALLAEKHTLNKENNSKLKSRDVRDSFISIQESTRLGRATNITGTQTTYSKDKKSRKSKTRGEQLDHVCHRNNLHGGMISF